MKVITTLTKRTTGIGFEEQVADLRCSARDYHMLRPFPHAAQQQGQREDVLPMAGSVLYSVIHHYGFF
jgi:hypothetical protein